MTTTPATTTWNIIDLSDGEIAGTAPGASQYDALAKFRADALDGLGTIAPEVDGDIEHLVLTDEGVRLAAQIATSALQAEPGRIAREIMSADLENGPSGDDVDEPGPLERADALTDQLHEERLELQRIDNERRAAHERYDATGSDEDMATISKLSGDGARQRRFVRQLERELEEARTAAIEHQPAHQSIARFELVDEENAKRGLPVSLDEAGDLGFASVLWERAVHALDAGAGYDHEPTNREVAERVAETYATLWMGSNEPTAAERQAARDGSTADAERLENTEWSKLNQERLVNALAVIVTDPRIRVGLDPKALEQARTALELAD